MCYYLVLLIADQRAEFVRGADRDAALQRGEDRQRLPGLLRPVPLAGERDCVPCLVYLQNKQYISLCIRLMSPKEVFRRSIS